MAHQGRKSFQLFGDLYRANAIAISHASAMVAHVFRSMPYLWFCGFDRFWSMSSLPNGLSVRQF
jgi:predicted LPLAT superfamily acyltransferase